MPAKIDHPFRLHIRSASGGWSGLRIDLDGKVWQCAASYIWSHPARDLIYAAIGLYYHLHVAPLPPKAAAWDCSVDAEEGDMTVRMNADGGRVKVSIFDNSNGKNFRPEIAPDALGDGEGRVDYWTFADAVFEASARAVASQGLSGIRQQWMLLPWNEHNHIHIFPVEHFLFLAALVKYREPRYNPGFDEELELLTEIRRRFPGD